MALVSVKSNNLAILVVAQKIMWQGLSRCSSCTNWQADGSKTIRNPVLLHPLQTSFQNHNLVQGQPQQLMPHSLVRLLLFYELTGGWIEDLAESFPSSPSTDFVSESQPSGLASTISLGNIASLMMHKIRPYPTNSNDRGPQHGLCFGQEHHGKHHPIHLN